MDKFIYGLRQLIFGFLLILTPIFAAAQSTRINENNLTAWGTINADWNLNEKLGIHLDINQRRVNITEDIFQHLYRIGMNYKPNKNIYLRAGYVLSRTSPFGDIQEAVSHQTSTEHRTYESISFSSKAGRLETSHRIIMEQRWNGKFSSPDLNKQDSWSYANRARYRIRFDYSFQKHTNQQSYPYIAAYDELMIHFGKQVKENVFDQNRIGCLTGYAISPVTRLEFGFMYQVLQLSKKYFDKNVFQNNSNLMVNLLLNLPGHAATK
ncbi:DUF2490 domain-containing protein [Flavihumibacter stibioxidans]|uniref:DUF2490 domain-containing protein n=1 Tax=Flavihumibacter stibioxidans TaxID=1834163 RepID=UPI00164F0C4A|nr:DUF2490 domain-containing protein [Flavihumibacter stibioxidans]